jgi:hypothetical protein
MSVGDLINWNGRIGLITETTERGLVVLFAGGFSHLFGLQWFEWARRKKQFVLVRD